MYKAGSLAQCCPIHIGKQMRRWQVALAEEIKDYAMSNAGFSVQHLGCCLSDIFPVTSYPNPRSMCQVSSCASSQKGMLDSSVHT